MDSSKTGDRQPTASAVNLSGKEMAASAKQVLFLDLGCLVKWERSQKWHSCCILPSIPHQRDRQVKGPKHGKRYMERVITVGPTIHDVARLAGTSKSTVSRYLNGQQVKKQRRKRWIKPSRS
ncbi:hypothetical protein CPT76_20445 [Paenibacillus sp. AR247]|nr:hypothetical protein CPT76_20445 [Paenibacillus sp. AR247]